MAEFKEVLASHFSTLDGLSFVQIGANDGMMEDPIRDMVISHKWVGVMVEPLKPEFDKLVAGYTDCGDRLRFCNKAIACYDGVVTMWRALKGGNASTIKEERLKDKIRANATPLTVPCIRLQTLLDEYSIKALDLLQIDTEGYDWEIIKQLCTLDIVPRAIHFEAHLLGADHGPCFNFLERRGYKICRGASKRDALALWDRSQSVETQTGQAR